MANYQYPNRIRAYAALLIYRDAMIPFIEAALGSERIRLTLFNDETKRRNPPKYDAGMSELDRDTPVSDLIDQTDIPLLVEYHLGHFSSLNSNNMGQMRSIRQLWNDKIKHDIGLGDCKAEIADKCIDLCVRVLRRCGLNEAADEIASLSSSTPAISTSVPAAATRKLAPLGDDIKSPPDWFAADQSPQLRRQAEFARPVQQLASSMSHDLMLREDGSVTGWGKNHYGQCDAPDGKFTAVSAGGYHSLGLRENGAVECWGDNSYGQCDAPDGKFTAVSAGQLHSLGLREDGTVECWGGNGYGQCDAPDNQFIVVSAGENHNVGLREDGSVQCWGDNRFGQCDAPDGRFTTVSAGGHHSIGLREDGSVECWGDNRFRQRDAPDGKFTAVSAGENHSLGLREDGSVAGWGDKGDGQCNAPEGKFIAVSAGGYHSLGLREDGSVSRWGWQEDGRGNPPEGNSLP